ncbi:MAG TPA: hypothetical protein DEA99_02935 [Candidatus Omnitrophica bacterium]|nr:hypothetical protein [Candidatus Omnitrophota bacterium]
MFLLDVSVLSPRGVIFEGKAGSVILPGEQGVFEIMPFHKHILSLLVGGNLTVDEKDIPVKRGIAKIELNKVTVIIE